MLRPAVTPAGKQAVSGVIVAVKEVMGYTGYTEHKLIVRGNRGFTVYVSSPKLVNDYVNDGDFRELVVGKPISFNADPTVSERDECFAFAKRPTKTTFDVCPCGQPATGWAEDYDDDGTYNPVLACSTCVRLSEAL